MRALPLVLVAGSLLGMVVISPAATADFRTDAIGGHATWRLGAVTINVDQGTFVQQSDHFYIGDSDCVCHHRDAFGVCNGWIAHGDWYLTRRPPAFDGADGPLGHNSFLQLGVAPPTAVWSIHAHADGYIAALSQCQTQLNAAKAAQEAATSAEHSRFATVSGEARAISRIAVSVPLTGLAVGAPYSEICSKGTASWAGSYSTASFDFSGPASLCVGNIPLPGLQLVGRGSGPV